MKVQKIYGWLGWVTVAVILGCLFGFGVKNSIINVQAQSKEKKISLAYSRNPQLKFAEAKTGQKSQKFDEDFNEDRTWLEELSFSLENISGKSIVYLEVNVNFPETKSSGNLMSYPISFGQRPGSKHKQKKPMLLMPGEVLKVSLKNEYNKISNFVNSRNQIDAIDKIQLEIGFIVFEDGLAWNAGTFSKQDPNNPNRYTDIGNELPQK